MAAALVVKCETVPNQAQDLRLLLIYFQLLATPQCPEPSTASTMSKENPLNDADRFDASARQIVGKRLTYAERCRFDFRKSKYRLKRGRRSKKENIDSAGSSDITYVCFDVWQTSESTIRLAVQCEHGRTKLQLSCSKATAWIFCAPCQMALCL